MLVVACVRGYNNYWSYVFTMTELVLDPIEGGSV